MTRKPNQRDEFLAELARTFASQCDADDWMRQPNAAFGGRAPRELVTAGESERVRKALYGLNAGVPA